MMFILLLVLIAYALGNGVCNTNDKLIYASIGHTFKEKFRSFGGLWTSQSSFEERVRNEVGLSQACAHCYGVAYICGYDSCKFRCISPSSSCDTCLVDARCTPNCDACTGF